jgi:ABC-type transport system involved in multi-copper enzyme maturation permease subunit
MADPLDASRHWLRRNLAWSNQRLDWQEQVALALLAVACCSGWWFGDQLGLLPLLALAGLLLPGVAYLLRRGWLKLFGPVVAYELVHTTRRSHFTLYRFYGYFIVITLSLFYVVWALRSPTDEMQATVRARDMPAFAGMFVYTFLALQLLVLGILTPAYIAGALAEEKERGTLEYLLATDLRNREIILGKVLARLLNLLLILLTGLPVVAFLQFLGGVDPLLTLLGFAATGVTMLGLAGLSVVNSVYARKARNAIVLTFLEATAYLLLSVAVWSLFLVGAMAPVATVRVPWFTPLYVADLLHWLDDGNPIVTLGRLTQQLAGGVSLADALPPLLRDYALFHLVLAGTCIAWASLRLRAVFRKQAYEQAKRVRAGWWRAARPPVGRWPMAWKEVFAEPGLRFGWVGRLVVAIFVVCSILPALELLWLLLTVPRLQVTAATMIGPWARWMGALVACLLLLRVAVHASTAISGERDRQTFDGLLTTPLSAGAILGGKWLGSVTSVRWGWLWLGIIWGTGVCVDGIAWRALVLLVVAWWIYAAVLGVLGLWFSLVSRSSLRATVLTLFTTLGVGVSYLLSLSLLPGSGYLFPVDSFQERFHRLLQGVSPLLSLAELLPFTDGNSRITPQAMNKAGWEPPTAMLGLVIWIAGGVVLWLVLLHRFRRVTARQAVRRPEGEAPPAVAGYESKAVGGVPIRA